jgi:hypothetical protein
MNATAALVFVGVCVDCGTPTEPCPAEGTGETWKTAEQWLFLALDAHKGVCLGRPTKDGQLSIFSPDAGEVTR